MARHHRILLHAAKSSRMLFVLIVLGLVTIDILAKYVTIHPMSLVIVSLSAVIPSMVSVWIAHSDNPEMHFLPSVIILVVGVIIVAVMALGCDMEWFGEMCFGGFAGPAVMLGVMVSWAGVTFAFGLGSYKKMLRHGKIR